MRINHLLACLQEMAEWMQLSHLCPNPTKSQFIHCTTARHLAQLDVSSVTHTPMQLVRSRGFSDGFITELSSACEPGR